MDQENIWPLGRGKNWIGGKSKYRNENTAACSEWLALHGCKDKLLAACFEKTLDLQKWKWKIL